MSRQAYCAALKHYQHCGPIIPNMALVSDTSKIPQHEIDAITQAYISTSGRHQENPGMSAGMRASEALSRDSEVLTHLPTLLGLCCFLALIPLLEWF